MRELQRTQKARMKGFPGDQPILPAQSSDPFLPRAVAMGTVAPAAPGSGFFLGFFLVFSWSCSWLCPSFLGLFLALSLVPGLAPQPHISVLGCGFHGFNHTLEFLLDFPLFTCFSRGSFFLPRLRLWDLCSLSPGEDIFQVTASSR